MHLSYRDRKHTSDGGKWRSRTPVLADPSVFKAAPVPDEFTFQNCPDPFPGAYLESGPILVSIYVLSGKHERRPGESNTMPCGTHRVATGPSTTASSVSIGGRVRSRSSRTCARALLSKQAWAPPSYSSINDPAMPRPERDKISVRCGFEPLWRHNPAWARTLRRTEYSKPTPCGAIRFPSDARPCRVHPPKLVNKRCALKCDDAAHHRFIVEGCEGDGVVTKATPRERCSYGTC